MSKATLIPIALVSLSLAACEESYKAVPGENPPQIVVQDEDGKLDDSNIRAACTRVGFEVAATKYLINDPSSGDSEGEAAIVTCKVTR